MKKPYPFIILLFVITSTSLFFGCSKSNNPGPTATIIGKWNINADTSRTVGYPPYIIVGINSPYMQFNADGSGTQKYNMETPDYVFNFTYKLSNDSLTVNFPLQTGLPYAFGYTTVIKELTAHNMVTESSIDDGEISNTEVVYFSR